MLCTCLSDLRNKFTISECYLRTRQVCRHVTNNTSLIKEFELATGPRDSFQDWTRGTKVTKSCLRTKIHQIRRIIMPLSVMISNPAINNSSHGIGYGKKKWLWWFEIGLWGHSWLLTQRSLSWEPASSRISLLISQWQLLHRWLFIFIKTYQTNTMKPTENMSNTCTACPSFAFAPSMFSLNHWIMTAD